MTESEHLFVRINRAATSIDPGLTDRDVERLLMRSHGKARRRVFRRVGLAAITVGLGALMVVRLGTTDVRGTREVADGKTPAPVSRARPGAGQLKLADGSTVIPLDAETQLKAVENSERRVTIELGRGRGRFDVVPMTARSFEVHAGDVTIAVVGTVFTVERVADRVGVSVERGSVRVNWGMGQRQLNGGENGWFPPLQVKSGATSAENLLAAADAARLAGRPQDGVMLLRRLLREHGADPRAPLAAFTLGRVLMMEIDRPREAAAAFADAGARAPRGPFAEDALAREVEAWSRAGDAVRAGARAREYLRRFPNGRRADAVRTFGGIE